jgi:hypothetical protein
MTTPTDKRFFNRQALRMLPSLKNFLGLPLFFLLLISLPLLDQLLKNDPASLLNEKRKLAEKPRFSMKDPLDFFKAYESYFNDNFAFRGQLVSVNNLIEVKAFRTSPLAKVVIGKNGWLFLGRETKSSDETAYFRSLDLFTPTELERWQRTLRQRWRWLQRRGICYVFMVIPNKSTIYPEYMPDHIRKANPRSRLDQLLAVLRQDADFPVLDLREAMLKKKSAFPLYYRTDSHWTELGAYFAYEKIVERLAPLFPGLKTPSLDQFTVESASPENGDLALMLSLRGGQFSEAKISLKPKTPWPFTISHAKKKLGPYVREIVNECPGGPLPPALIVHDSFMHQLKPFLKPLFRRSVFIWDWELRFFLKEVEREKPRVVIEEMVERSLWRLVPANPPELEPQTIN